MPKTLCLLRHAKSSWAHPALADIDRPLNACGERACATMAPVLASNPPVLEHIVCSPARRAQQTLELVSGQLGTALHWYSDDALYSFDAREVLDWLIAGSFECETLTLVGHNPAFTDICNTLADCDLENLPTCGLALLQLDCARWCDIVSGCGELLLLSTPKRVREAQSI